jgi:hypothetical protein
LVDVDGDLDELESVGQAAPAQAEEDADGGPDDPDERPLVEKDPVDRPRRQVVM